MSTILNTTDQLAVGTYRIKYTNTYLYKKINKILKISEKGLEIIPEEGLCRYSYLEQHIEPASYNEVYKAYLKILKQTDNIFGTRGVLIKPQELEKRVELDLVDRVILKY